MNSELSVIIPVTSRCGKLTELHARYATSFATIEMAHMEFIYVVAPPFTSYVAQLKALSTLELPILIVELARDFGDAVAIKIGAAQAKYPIALILPPFEQVAPEDIVRLVSMQEDVDIVCVKRWPRLDSKFKQIPTQTLRWLMQRFSDAPYGDAACIIALCKRAVLDEVNMYGEFHRFLPLLAHDQGYSVKVVELPQSSVGDHYFSSIFVYFRRFLDLMSILFLTKFNRRPLRFFGAIGSVFFLIGVLGLAYVGIERLIHNVGVANRPVLVLYSLFLVLGVQLVAIGLVGETLIFTQGKATSEYKIRRIHN